VLFSWTGTWMLNAGAQWLVVDAANAAALVSLVQAASTLPSEAPASTVGA
jgi:hypothetical protein